MLRNNQIQPNQTDHDRRIGIIIGCAVLAMIFGCLGIFPLMAVLGFQIMKQCAYLVKESDSDAPAVRNVACGEYLKTCGDYIRAVQSLPLETMPLGIYGEHAVRQIEQLRKKQQGMQAMLGNAHPFLKNTAEAEQYVLANCKKILWRLKYCDQSDAQLCGVHAAYLQERLCENEKVLRDYENLLIEITQMDDDTPSAEPTLDVLADSLRTLRGDDQQQMMM